MTTIEKRLLLEEVGQSLLAVQCITWWEYTPGEPRTWDYPGSLEALDLVGVEVQRVVGEFWALAGDELPSWINDYVEAWILNNLEYAMGVTYT